MPNRADPSPVIPSDPLDWRPQRALPTRTARAVTNAIIEPLWDGDHVLAHVVVPAGDRRAGVRLVSETGDDVTDTDAEVSRLLGEALLARDAVIDGFLTTQATRPGDTVSLTPTVKKGKFTILSPRQVEADFGPQDTDLDLPIAFVAVDLLRVDGEDLFDVPLLERKRILDSILSQGPRIRVSPYTQPPVSQWIASWKAAGFRGAILKAANSRYRPGSETGEWTETLGTKP